MFTFTSYRNYFENIALQHVNISHTSYKAGERGFFWFERENMLASMKDTIVQPKSANRHPVALFVLPYEAPYDDPGNGNILRNIDASYMLLAPVSEVNNETEVCEVLTKCEVIAHQINLRIMRDANTDNELFARADIDLSNFTIIPILRQANNYYGIQCLMQFRTSDVTKCVQGQTWNDIDDELNLNPFG